LGTSKSNRAIFEKQATADSAFNALAVHVGGREFGCAPIIIGAGKPIVAVRFDSRKACLG
jgi:hypothetical protein